MPSNFERLAELDREIPTARESFNGARDAIGLLLPRNPNSDQNLDRIIKHAESFGPAVTADEITAHPSRFGWSSKAPTRDGLLTLLVHVVGAAKHLDHLLAEQRTRQARQDLNLRSPSPTRARRRDRDR